MTYTITARSASCRAWLAEHPVPVGMSEADVIVQASALRRAGFLPGFDFNVIGRAR